MIRLPPSTWARALGVPVPVNAPICRYCGQRLDGPDTEPTICSPCWNQLYHQDRIQEFTDPSDGTRRVMIDGKDVT